MSKEAFQEFISNKLFTETKPVIFSDLINKFKCGPNKAKEMMYSYYEDTKNVKFQCIIVACYSNNKIKIINDIEHIENQELMIDCFIYAFNPMDEFLPVNIAIDQHDDLIIKNPNRIKIEDKTIKIERAQTVESKAVSTFKPIGQTRSKTVPEATPVKKEEHKKSMGLRSTELLVRMRKEREQKEFDRQEELRKRKQQQVEQRNKSDPKRVAQMEDLNKLFVDDDDDDDLSKTESPTKDGSPIQAKSEVINASELEELLDTTAEESLLELSQDPSKNQKPKIQPKKGEAKEEEEEVTTYLDKDGYMVTKKTVRPTETAGPTPKKRPAASTLMNFSSKLTKKQTPKKKQGSIESFFKLSK